MTGSLFSFVLRVFIMATVLAASSLAALPTRAQSAGRAVSKKESAYSCPMHASVKSESPGRCPKCGMNLLPARDGLSDADLAGAGARGVMKSKMVIPDVELVDQDGQKVRFYSDLVKGKVVVINFIFTTCTTICPPLGATFARVQKELGDRAGRETHFISISVDPVTDTPERLKAWGAKFKAGHGWTFVTGEKPKVDELLRALAASTARPGDHSPTVIIGNDARGQWTRAYGLAKPSRIVEIINDAVEGRLEPDVKESN